MKNIAKNFPEDVLQENVVKTKRRGYFRTIEEVKVVAKLSSINQQASSSKDFPDKVWVVSNSRSRHDRDKNMR